MRLLHAMIRVTDIHKSLDFYTKLLDMNLTYEMKLSDCTLYYLSDEDGQTQIELTHNNRIPGGGYDIGDGFGHFAFSVKNMDDFSKKLYELGYEYYMEPFILDVHNMKIAFIKDPDGYEIELIEDK